VEDLTALLKYHKVDYTCVNRTELDRQHLANVDLVVAVGGDGTVLSAAHFLDHGTIPLLGINVSFMLSFPHHFIGLLLATAKSYQFRIRILYPHFKCAHSLY
jgi:NAD kinase